MTNQTFVAMLAEAFLGGEQTPKAAAERTLHAIGHEWRWVRSLAVRYITRFGNERPKVRAVIQFLWSDARLRRCLGKYRADIKLLVNIPQQPLLRMAPVNAASAWNLPAIETIGDLAAWLELDIAQLVRRSRASQQTKWRCKAGTLSLPNVAQRLRRSASD